MGLFRTPQYFYYTEVKVVFGLTQQLIFNQSRQFKHYNDSHLSS